MLPNKSSRAIQTMSLIQFLIVDKAFACQLRRDEFVLARPGQSHIGFAHVGSPSHAIRMELLGARGMICLAKGLGSPTRVRSTETGHKFISNISLSSLLVRRIILLRTESQRLFESLRLISTTARV